MVTLTATTRYVFNHILSNVPKSSTYVLNPVCGMMLLPVVTPEQPCTNSRIAVVWALVKAPGKQQVQEDIFSVLSSLTLAFRAALVSTWVSYEVFKPGCFVKFLAMGVLSPIAKIIHKDRYANKN